eukprot:Nk52_evm6s242 gene=Nk52_evmTU6s242
MRTALIFIAVLVSMLLAFTLASPMAQEESESHIVSKSHGNPKYQFTAVLRDHRMKTKEICVSDWTSVEMEHTSKYSYKPVLKGCKFASKVDASVELDKQSFNVKMDISVTGITEEYSIKEVAASTNLKKTAMQQYIAFTNTKFTQPHFRYFSYVAVDSTSSHDYNLGFYLDFDFDYGANEAKN